MKKPNRRLILEDQIVHISILEDRSGYTNTCILCGRSSGHKHCCNSCWNRYKGDKLYEELCREERFYTINDAQFPTNRIPLVLREARDARIKKHKSV